MQVLKSAVVGAVAAVVSCVVYFAVLVLMPLALPRFLDAAQREGASGVGGVRFGVALADSYPAGGGFRRGVLLDAPPRFSRVDRLICFSRRLWLKMKIRSRQ